MFTLNNARTLLLNPLVRKRYLKWLAYTHIVGRPPYIALPKGRKVLPASRFNDYHAVETQHPGEPEFVLIDTLLSSAGNGVFIDIGSNIGTMSVLAHSTGHTSRIVALEPNARYCPAWHMNMSLNGIEQATLVQAAAAFVTTRDTLHPMIYLGAMAFFLHAFLPLHVEITQPYDLRGYLDQDELDYAQTIVLLGVLSLGGGVWWGAERAPAYFHARPVELTRSARIRLVRAAIALATLGLAAWIYQIIYSGGLYAVYGHPYGWFGAESGYVYEAFQFGLPGALLLLLARSGFRLRPWDLAWIGISLLPLLGHGLLGARRGPTFMALVGVGVMWYLMRARRPRLGVALLGGLAVGLLALFLLANRDRIHLGAEADFTSPSQSSAFEVGPGNEFVFGAGAALNAESLDKFMWGRRYLVVLFIRPIPRFLWPTKYADAARFLNIPSLDHVEKDPLVTDFTGTIGWTGAIGSAPGGIFDLWLEFSWACLFAVFAIGWGFGRAYRKALSQGGFWTPLYALMTALSIYFIMQGLEAFAFRLLLLGAVLWLGWRYAVGSGVLAPPGRARSPRSPPLPRVLAGSAGADRSA